MFEFGFMVSTYAVCSEPAEVDVVAAKSRRKSGSGRYTNKTSELGPVEQETEHQLKWKAPEVRWLLVAGTRALYESMA